MVGADAAAAALAVLWLRQPESLRVLGVACGRIGPHRVGKLLQLELAHPSCRFRRDRLEYIAPALRGPPSRRCVGQVLQIELAHPSCRLRRDGLEQRPVAL